MTFVALAYLAVVVGVGCYVLTLLARQRLMGELADAAGRAALGPATGAGGPPGGPTGAGRPRA